MAEKDWKGEIERTAREVLELLSAGRAGTAWEFKMQLKVSHTPLHLALGMLLERGAISMSPDRLTYAVRPAGSEPASPGGEPRSETALPK